MGTLTKPIAPICAPLVEELQLAMPAWEACRRLAALPNVLFLDSAGEHPGLGRYSFVTADPFDWLWSKGGKIGSRLPVRGMAEADPFRLLGEKLARFSIKTEPGLPPFQGGVAGLFGYDLCHHLERLPGPAHDDLPTPDLAVGFYDWALGFDHETGRTWLMATGLPEEQPRRREKRARQRLAMIHKLLDHVPGPETWQRIPTEPVRAPNSAVPGMPGVSSNFARDEYLHAVGRAIEYIHAGDCFQVNLAQRLLYPLKIPPLELYGRLRERNPAPFAGYFDLGNHVIASASPERFLKVRHGAVETRPIKGTRPRAASAAADQALREELLASAKERAENVMIVDLLRNDLGRVCTYGTVRVEALCRLESFRYVHHLVSEVHGQLRPGLGPIDLLRAAFPGGSVTGAPKIRAMEIIAELEPTARGPYCGSLGYIGFDGSMDVNLLIRTFTLGRGWAQFCVGGGIVADSKPESEYEETWHKAAGLLRALSEV
jgi:para-aminobenzoate synthetase component I